MSLHLISEVSAERLLRLPESGMGYQIVRDCSIIWIVFNATIAVPLAELRGFKLTAEYYKILSGETGQITLLDKPKIELSQEVFLSFSLLDQEHRKEALGLSFPDAVTVPAPKRYRRPPSPYYRFSAFYRDCRVDSSGNFLPGTYATTFSDMRVVPSGLAAVGRYALPNPASARYIYSVVTYDQPSLLGAVTPNFGQAGGGVEVLFNSGAKNTHGACFPINVG